MSTLLCLHFAMCLIGPLRPPPITLSHMEGNLSEYSIGVMDRVLLVRLGLGEITQSQIDGADVYAAVYSCEWIGHTGYIQYKEAYYSLLITDCANVAHENTARFFHSGIIAEVDGDFAKAHNLQINGRQAEIFINE
jgi:hypothetical protein